MESRVSILHVCTNNDALLSKYFFLCHVILPSCVSGNHPMLNVSVLVYDGKEYSTVRISVWTSKNTMRCN